MSLGSPLAARQRQALREYLALGFVPDTEIASSYVRDLFAAAQTRDGDPASLLVEIVADLTAGASAVVIPLTGGRDSRALLGAALHVFPNRQIHCVTFGPAGSADVEGARVACKSARVSHEVIDPDTFEWDLDLVTADIRRPLDARSGVPPIDGVVAFGTLARTIPPGLPVLSGFLGDATIGSHLLGEASGEDHARALELFYSQNSAVLQERPDAVFYEFLIAHEQLRQSWPALTNFDLLDLGFRQRQRIRPSVSSTFETAVRPYEDPRWIAHWFSGPLAKRVDYAEYDLILRRAFPLMFGRMPLRWRFRRWSARTYGSAMYRGDPRRNPSMAAALEEACRAFDRRDIAAGQSGSAAFDELMRRPSASTFEPVRWFATAEMLARAWDLP